MKSSNYIAESVFKVNLHFSKLQNKTKELYFKCLNENKSTEYFKKELKKIWKDTNYNFIDKEIEKYQAIVHQRNTRSTEKVIFTEDDIIAPLDDRSKVMKYEEKFKKVKVNEYNNSINSYAYQNDKQNYLKKKVAKYSNEIVPYHFKDTNKIQRHVQLSTYNAMVHNVNLVRAGWNMTLYDADIIGNQEFWIPYHPFSCSYCISHQNKILTKKEVINMLGKANEQQGDVLHPNCKCEITFYNKDTIFNRPNYSDAELDEQYHIRQKVNTLTLKKEEVLTDIKIQKDLGNQDEVDRLNKFRNKINQNIRDLKNELPTESLKKQVVAINR